MAKGPVLSDHIPHSRYKTVKSATWAEFGNLHTEADVRVKSNSVILIHHTSAYNGRWFISAINDGVSFTITSSDPEDAGITFRYEIL